MAQIENVAAVVNKLIKLRQQAGVPTPSVTVGYTAEYALYVHENLECYHPVGQAKFLEQPAREMKDELAAIVARGVRSGMTLGNALLVAGFRLQRASQQLVPVDTGNLRASAFTKLE